MPAALVPPRGQGRQQTRNNRGGRRAGQRQTGQPSRSLTRSIAHTHPARHTHRASQSERNEVYPYQTHRNIIQHHRQNTDQHQRKHTCTHAQELDSDNNKSPDPAPARFGKKVAPHPLLAAAAAAAVDAQTGSYSQTHPRDPAGRPVDYSHGTRYPREYLRWVYVSTWAPYVSWSSSRPRLEQDARRPHAGGGLT